ncbi:hypothetical protein H4R34_000698 [Dimargaris verticillata]|uniref:C2H2-type domain-containing protein n=1 Tax=Dimargaris verticillata TaxID=2761393 RepID=A0A9W8EF57_9FUNG|nr:hypothetical protein H4R34_000698 [Dimargaris verticillata]
MSKHDTDHGSPEAMTCHWRGCTVGVSFENSIHLFEHITKSHIGRKASNNLCLQCHWEECSFEAKKRDHITSHMRSHIDYRPHMCPYCRKTFKRPQDLKKHEKTHSETLPTPVSAGVAKGAATAELHRSSFSSDYYPTYQTAPTVSYPPPASHTTGHLAVSSPHALPDSPSSLNAYVPELSPDNVVPSTGVTISDQSDSESAQPGHGGAKKRPRDPLEDLLANSKAKQQATYNQGASNVYFKATDIRYILHC